MNHQKKLLIIMSIAFVIGITLGNRFFMSDILSYQANIISSDRDCSASEHIVTCKKAIQIDGGECEAMEGNKIKLKSDKFNGFCSFSTGTTDNDKYSEIYLYRAFPIKDSAKKLYMKFVKNTTFIDINGKITGGMSKNDVTGATMLNVNGEQYKYNESSQQWDYQATNSIIYSVEPNPCNTLNGQVMLNSPMCIKTAGNLLLPISLAKLGNRDLYLSKSNDKKHYLHKNDSVDINKWSAEYLKFKDLTEGDFSITYSLADFYAISDQLVAKTYAAGTEAPPIVKLQFGALKTNTGEIIKIDGTYAGKHDITDYSNKQSGKYISKITLTASEWNTLKNNGANIWRAVDSSEKKATRWISLEDKDVTIEGKDLFLSSADNELSKVIKNVNEVYSETKDGKTVFLLGEAMSNQVKLIEEDIKAIFSYDNNIFFMGNGSLFYTLASGKEIASELINVNCTDVSLQVINKESNKEANKFYQGFTGIIIYQHKTRPVPAVTWTINGDITWEDSNDTAASRDFKITDVAKTSVSIKASATFNGTVCESTKLMPISEDMTIDVPAEGIDVYSNSL